MISKILKICFAIFVFSSNFLFADDNYEKAKELFKKSIETEDDQIKLRYREEIVKLVPDSDIGYFSKAYLIKEGSEKDTEEVIKLYTRAIEKNKKFSYAFVNRGVIYHNKGDLDKALQDYNKGEELNPKYY